MGLIKNLWRTITWSDEKAKRSLVGYELSIESKIDKGIPLDVNEEEFYFRRRDEIARKMGMTDIERSSLRNELKDTWRNEFHR